MSTQGTDRHDSIPEIINFDSPIVTLRVGDWRSMGQKFFNIHESVLYRFPKFKELCSDENQESKALQFNLAEDNPDIFQNLAHWMYTSQYECDDPSLLKDTYCMAAKYNLSGLKKKTVRNLTRALDGCAVSDELFYGSALAMYSIFSAQDDNLLSFRRFYIKHGAMRAGLWNNESPDCLMTCLEQGGMLAVDTYGILKSAGRGIKRENQQSYNAILTMTTDILRSAPVSRATAPNDAKARLEKIGLTENDTTPATAKKRRLSNS